MPAHLRRKQAIEKTAAEQKTDTATEKVDVVAEPVSVPEVPKKTVVSSKPKRPLRKKKVD